MAEIASPAVPLFQRAHARMVTLARVDEQLASLLQQRSRIQEELRAVQAQINEEFERITHMDEEAPAKILSQISEIARGNQNPPRMEAQGARMEEETHAVGQ
jgi:predicted  nucleic acid-binding Zn-ribbon protein